MPLGIILKNEQYTAEMVAIMNEISKYVLSIRKTQTISGEEIKYTVLHPILFGGDQLTVQTARAAKTAMSGAEMSLERLEGLVPVIEDWHARLSLLKVLCNIILWHIMILCIAHAYYIG